MVKRKRQQKLKPVQFPKKRNRGINRLQPVQLQRLEPGLHLDGAGLYLVVQDSGSRSWILRVTVRGKRRDIGLGGLSTTSLQDARDEAVRLRSLARKGEDILARKHMEQRKANTPTFEDAAKSVHQEVAPSLNNEHNKTVWLNSLKNHVFPVFGNKMVNAVDSADVLKAIGPIWAKKPDMARKTLARIRRVMDWATLQGYRNVMAGEIVMPLPNPCTGIQAALPKQPKEGNHTAIPYTKVPEFIASMRAGTSGVAVKLATEFTVLTAARTSEVLEAKWDEIDLDAKVWAIPAERMKMEVAHTVPLSQRCVEILEAAKTISDGGGLIFPSSTKDEPLSNVVMLRALQRMEGYDNVTMHGFRSCFKTWATEKTRYRDQVIESCLAHKFEGLDDNYLRTTFPDHRRKLMQEWARFVTAPAAAKVVNIRG